MDDDANSVLVNLEDLKHELDGRLSSSVSSIPSVSSSSSSSSGSTGSPPQTACQTNETKNLDNTNDTNNTNDQLILRSPVSFQPNPVNWYTLLQQLLPNVSEEFLHLFDIQHVPADGNCFFSSLSIILDSMKMRYSVQALRDEVAASILDEKDLVATQALTHWVTIAKALSANQLDENELDLMHEFCHVWPILDQPNFLDSRCRRQVASIMQQRFFWAEEYCIRLLETKLQMHFLMLTLENKKDKGWVLRPHALFDSLREPQKYEVFGLFLLCCKHYQPISIQGHFMFHVRTLPTCLRNLFHVQYVNPVQSVQSQSH